MTTTQPPGFATRTSSATAARGFGECSIASTEKTTSKLSSGHGIDSSEPRIAWIPAGSSFRSDGEMSTPVHSASGNRARTALRNLPLPQPTSSTR